MSTLFQLAWRSISCRATLAASLDCLSASGTLPCVVVLVGLVFVSSSALLVKKKDMAPFFLTLSGGLVGWLVRSFVRSDR